MWIIEITVKLMTQKNKGIKSNNKITIMAT